LITGNLWKVSSVQQHVYLVMVFQLIIATSAIVVKYDILVYPLIIVTSAMVVKYDIFLETSARGVY
jgi:hypothetical protein